MRAHVLLKMARHVLRGAEGACKKWSNVSNLETACVLFVLKLFASAFRRCALSGRIADSASQFALVQLCVHAIFRTPLTLL